MRSTHFFWIIAGLLSLVPSPSKGEGEVKPVSFTKVHINDTFWKQRLNTLQQKTIRYAFQQCENAGYIRNFEYAGKILSGEAAKGSLTYQSGTTYDDAEVYKVIEGASYVLSVQNDPELEAYVDGVIDKIVSAQEPDGYLFTNWTIANPLHGWMGGVKWQNDCYLSHETFDMGELYEAAIAYYYATGKDKLLQAAIKNADLICQTFNRNGIHMAPGHAVIEMALVRLYEATGDEKYLNECKFFLDCRGEKSFNNASIDLRENGKYWQNHMSAVDQREAVGHAVRAMYFYSGMADWVRLSGDEKYEAAIDAIWDNIVSKKMYLTGGYGARDENEAFGNDYELPNASAYCETCASVASCMFNLRMFRLHKDARYIDVLERALYNTVLSGLSAQGDKFFYPNRLETSKRGQGRSEWFSTSCCPTNLCRLIPSVPGYVYATDDNALFVNLFIASESEILVGGKSLTLTQQTSYPYDGKVSMTLSGIQGEGNFDMRIRIPGWAQNKPVCSDLYTYVGELESQPELLVNGQSVNFELQNGYAVIQREWAEGDVITLNLPMEARQVKSNDHITSNQGLLAVERGPLVYCAEFADNGGNLDKVYLKSGTRFALANGMQTTFPGMKTLKANGVTLIPYFARSYRGDGEMKVWIPESSEVRKPEGLIDEVVVCNSTSENTHSMKGSNMRSDGNLGWRDAYNGYISYVMQVDPERPCDLILKHWGGDGGNREFNIYVDDVLFSYHHCNYFLPNSYYEMRHNIPFHLTKGKKQVTIKLQSLPNNTVGGIYGCMTALQELLPNEAVIVDYLHPEASSLTDHGCNVTNNTGKRFEHPYIEASGSTGMTFKMQVDPNQTNYLLLNYWGGEKDIRKQTVSAEILPIGKDTLYHNCDGYFFNRLYEIPDRLTKGKNSVKIKISSSAGTKVGALYGAYTLTSDKLTDVTLPKETSPYAGTIRLFDIQGRPLQSVPAHGIYLEMNIPHNGGVPTVRKKIANNN